MKSILIVSLVAVLFIADFSDSAAVRSEEFEEELRRIVHDVYPDNLRIQRATESGNEERRKRYCYDTPCGWTSFDPMTRRGTLFMPNTCVCPDQTYKCIRTGENVSMSAYVYHCRQNTTVEDIEGEWHDEGESPEYGS